MLKDELKFAQKEVFVKDRGSNETLGYHEVNEPERFWYISLY